LRLASVFLRKRVQGGKSWYPAVHSLVRFNFGNQNAVDVPNVVDPTIAGEKPNGEVILRNVTLTSSMPFSGGIVSVKFLGQAAIGCWRGRGHRREATRAPTRH
jgi:hypothetical protein